MSSTINQPWICFLSDAVLRNPQGVDKKRSLFNLLLSARIEFLNQIKPNGHAYYHTAWRSHPHHNLEARGRCLRAYDQQTSLPRLQKGLFHGSPLLHPRSAPPKTICQQEQQAGLPSKRRPKPDILHAEGGRKKTLKEVRAYSISIWSWRRWAELVSP